MEQGDFPLGPFVPHGSVEKGIFPLVRHPRAVEHVPSNSFQPLETGATVHHEIASDRLNSQEDKLLKWNWMVHRQLIMSMHF